MKSLLNVSILIIFINNISIGQYSTPGIGIRWSLYDLVNYSNGAVVQEDNYFLISDSITISPTDTIYIITNEVVKLNFEILIKTQGVLQVNPPQELLFTAYDTTLNYSGFKFENSGSSFLKKSIIEFGGGINIIESDILIEECVIRKNDKSNTTGAIDIFHSNPEIINCEIYINAGPAILTSANGLSSPYIYNNNIYFNNTENTNMPQINLGTSSDDIEIRIIDNLIEGIYNGVGGIAVSTLAGGEIFCTIQGNTIKNNRYGITAYGNNISSVISDNIIQDNNIEGLPMQGGSGINFWGNTTNISIVSGNEISGNLWGITIQGEALPNIGQIEPDIINIGKNIIVNNGNDGIIYALYNNSPNNIYAENNFWGSYNVDSVETVIFHHPDDPSLGLVDYLPIKDYFTNISLNEENNEIFQVFPNPVRDKLYIDLKTRNNDLKNISFSIYNSNGHIIVSGKLLQIKDGIDLEMIQCGIYIIQIATDKTNFSTKFLKR